MNATWQKWIPWLMAISALVGVLVGQKMSESTFILPVDQNKEDWERENKIQRALEILSDNYYPSLSRDSIHTLALSGLLNGLDPYSRYIVKGERASSSILSFPDLDFGCSMIRHSGNLQVYQSEVDGLEIGDVISAIDGQPLAQIPSIRQYLDQRDTIQIKIARNGVDLALNMTKRKQDARSKVVSKRIDEQLVYIKPFSFKQGIYRALMNELEDFTVSGKPLNLILDLRNNPGGDLEETVKIINQLMGSKEEEYLRVEYGNGKEKNYSSTGKSFLNLNKVAILINQNTKSSAEIIAGSLKGQPEFQIIGQPSFGKETIQKLFTLDDDSDLYFTVGRFYFPENEKEEKTIEPDVFVKDQVQSRDTKSSQLDFIHWVQHHNFGSSVNEDVTDKPFDPQWLHWSTGKAPIRRMVLDELLPNDKVFKAAMKWINS